MLSGIVVSYASWVRIARVVAGGASAGPVDADPGLVEFHVAEPGAERDRRGIAANADTDDPLRRGGARRIKRIPNGTPRAISEVPAIKARTSRANV
jgi:hypothetical protein